MTTLTGILEWPQRAEGRVRQMSGTAIVQRDDDPFVPLAFGERFRLRDGLRVTVEVALRRPRRRRRGRGRGAPRPVVEQILAIEGLPPEQYSSSARAFEELTSIDPQPRLTLEYPGCPDSCRLIDLFCPIGRGQRGLIVSPPKAGKTTLLKDIAGAILRNHHDVEVVILLVDERPEEVTDFRRTFEQWTRAGVGSSTALPSADASGPAPEGVPPAGAPAPRCQVVGSSNDNDVEVHIAVATSTIDRAKRAVEAGRHVVVMLDSLTRLGRAFNRSRRHSSSGRTMTGGIDSRALEVPKQIFGAARNTEEAGSLTIIASCLVDTGSVGDQVIFEEFKGTGNMELILDRKIAERRLFPAINLAASGTRKEHLLMEEQELKTVTALRRRLMNMPPHLQIEQLLAALRRFPTNAALVGSAA
jgi:transcription termination factor Rho